MGDEAAGEAVVADVGGVVVEEDVEELDEAAGCCEENSRRIMMARFEFLRLGKCSSMVRGVDV